MSFRSHKAVFFGCFETLLRIPLDVCAKTGNGFGNDGLKQRRQLEDGGRCLRVCVKTGFGFYDDGLKLEGRSNGGT